MYACLDFDIVLLAWGFNMLDGQVEVTVPPVYTDDNYQIVRKCKAAVRRSAPLIQ